MKALLAILVAGSMAIGLGGTAVTAAASDRDGGQAVSLRHLAAEVRGLRVGSAVSVSALTADATYRQILGRQFSSVTPENEMKWGPLEPQRGVFDFGPADTLVHFAEEHGQLVRGHNLVWHSQLPDWLTQGSFTNAELAAILRQHIATEAGHWRGRIWQWDVVNEPLNEDGTLRSDIWLNALGPGYIADALRWTHAADPRARLFLNDFNIEGLGPKSDGMYDLVKGLLAQGVPIGGVGFESHLTLGGVPPTFEANLRRFAALGIQVSITELDVRMRLPATAGKLAQQAADYAQVLGACLAVRRCTDFTVWEYTDKYSWIPGFFTGQGAADIYDENLVPKPAYRSLVDTLEKARREER
jgi:GH35 family endo-1,4-beta-xylanase